MKKLVLILVLSGLFLSTVFAGGMSDTHGSDSILLDQSETNPVLVIGSVDVMTSDFGVKQGPSSMSFVKVQPSIGQRIVPKRDVRLFGDKRVFFFDAVKLGEVYKLYDFVWTVSVDKELETYVVAPGISGSELQFKVVTPGINYVGSYSYRQEISGDFELAESHVLESVLPHLDDTPQWKRLVEARLKELNDLKDLQESTK